METTPSNSVISGPNWNFCGWSQCENWLAEKSFNIITDFGLIFGICIDVSMELQNRIDFWKKKQDDIASQFEVLYQPIQTVKARKGRKKPHKEENRELSCYAGKLTKEFLTMVSFALFALVIYMYKVALLVSCKSNDDLSS